MKTTKLLLFGIATILLVSAFLTVGCTTEEDEKALTDSEKAALLITEGKELLTRGLSTEAEKQFREAILLDPTNGEARFGAVFSNFKALADQILSLVSMAAGLKTNGEPDRSEYLIELAVELISTLSSKLNLIADESEELITDYPDFRFTIDELMLVWFVRPGADISGTYTIGEATLMLAGVQALAGLLDMLLSQDLHIAIFSLLNDFENGKISDLGSLKAINALAVEYLPANPDFLALALPDGDQYFTNSGRLFAGATTNLLAAIELYSSGSPMVEDSVIGWGADEDGDYTGFVFDRIISEIKNPNYLFEPDDPTVDPFTYKSFFIPITEQLVDGVAAVEAGFAGDGRISLKVDVVNLLVGLVIAVSKIIDLEDLLGGVLPIDVSKLSPTILAGFLSPLIPDAVEFDPAGFFSTPVGMRSLLPVLNESGFVVEWECIDELDADGYPAGSFGAVCNQTEAPEAYIDIPHFIGQSYRIDADGVYFFTPIIAFADPGFNGLLYINVDGLGIENYPAAGGYRAATGADINALIFWVFNLIDSF